MLRYRREIVLWATARADFSVNSAGAAYICSGFLGHFLDSPLDRNDMYDNRTYLSIYAIYVFRTGIGGTLQLLSDYQTFNTIQAGGLEWIISSLGEGFGRPATAWG